MGPFPCRGVRRTARAALLIVSGNFPLPAVSTYRLMILQLQGRKSALQFIFGVIMNYVIYPVIQMTYLHHVLHQCLLLVTFQGAKSLHAFCIGDAFVVG